MKLAALVPAILFMLGGCDPEGAKEDADARKMCAVLHATGVVWACSVDYSERTIEFAVNAASKADAQKMCDSFILQAGIYTGTLKQGHWELHVFAPSGDLMAICSF